MYFSFSNCLSFIYFSKNLQTFKSRVLLCCFIFNITGFGVSNMVFTLKLIIDNDRFKFNYVYYLLFIYFILSGSAAFYTLVKKKTEEPPLKQEMSIFMPTVAICINIFVVTKRLVNK